MAPFDPNTIPQLPILRQAVRDRKLVPLIGAGISKQASPDFPNWRTLLQDMTDNAAKFNYLTPSERTEISELLVNNQFLMAAQELKYKYPTNAYTTFLTGKFDPPGVSPANIHRAIFDLKPQLILTTNYDRLLEDAYVQKFNRSASVKTYAEAPEVANYLHTTGAPRAPLIFKLHGDIEPSASSIILTEGDYRNLIYRQPGYRMVLSSIFITKVVLMLGFSFNDYELRLLLEGMREYLQHRSDPDYILLRTSGVNDTEKRRYREDYGIEVITYDPTPGDPEVLQFVNALASSASP